MSEPRRSGGDETWHRLSGWTAGQTRSERLAGHLLRLSGYASIDPSHPLGGRDGLKDLIAVRYGRKWIAAAHFSRERLSMSKLKKKFLDDYAGRG